MSHNSRSANELFSAALEILDVTARQAFVERECGQDAQLRQVVEQLLASHDAALSTPEHGSPAVTVTFEPLHSAELTETVDSIITGRYQLREKLG